MTATDVRAKKNVAEIDLTREDGKQILTIKVSAEIEKLFKTDETQTSERYVDSDGDGLEYYTEKASLARFMEKYNRVSSNRVELARYGTELFLDGKPNLSVLRTVGISEGIEVEVTDFVVDTEIQAWCQTLADFLKFMYNGFIAKATVKASINLEL